MLFLLKRLGLGIGLIILASGILLATDRDRRPGDGPRLYAVALVQNASLAVLDEGAQGAIDGLAEAGFREGDNLRITRYNAENDIGTANTIAREVVHGPFDLVLTISTVSLQTVTNANKDRRRKHVFGLVADPFSAGVGLDRKDPKKHPPWMVGQGIFLPVEEAFQLARQMNPALKSVGVVWNPAEANSEAYTQKGREVCKKWNLTLLEANAGSSAEVLEATQSLVGRGAQAIWIGGDVTVMAAIDSVIATARKAGIPVFSLTPGKPDRGTFFDVGINFYECGKLTGKLAADVLHGADPAGIPIEDVVAKVSRRLTVNQQVLAGLKGGWQLPPDLLRRAEIVVDEQGVVHKAR